MDDFTARANREAARLASAGNVPPVTGGHERLVNLLALAWLHGYREGTTDTGAEAQRAFSTLIVDLADRVKL